MNIQEHVALARLTTIRVGGNARFFVEAKSVADIIEALAFASEHSLQVCVLGGGSNVVIADEGFDGLVLAMCSSGITYEDLSDRVVVTADAGVVWDDLVADTVARGYSGLECLSGVPGTVGGAVVANIGAYGAQCSDTFVSAEVLDCYDIKNDLRVFKKDECDFSYHDSIFGRAHGRYLVVRATFTLSTSGVSKLAYKDNRFDLEALAGASGHKPTLAGVRAAILKMRSEKGVLAGSYKSAGSFFHMPYVSSERYEQIVEVARSLDAEKEERLRPWAWKQTDGSYKLAPGFLLEYTEFQKGYVRGSVGISPKHTLSIINVADARASDIAQLAHDMHIAVENIFGVNLEREVEYIGAVT
ncbi:MAG: UDP-N-acetylmuramate dehydrogenase [Candidatus Paceibacterota bacterium]|jgi:UDP-N-acetylmuramate dehydrogenase